MKRLLAAYGAYLPAITTLVGAAIVAVGLLPSKGSEPIFQWLRLVGAIIAAIGAFWSGHRQIIGAEQAKERNKKIVLLQEQLHGHTTEGDSFCYAYPMFGIIPEKFHWVFIHQGAFPLIDVSVRIYNLASKDGQLGPGRTYELETIFPGRSHTFATTPVESRLSSHGYNLFFLARNGSWTQQIRWAELPGLLAVANRVVRDGASLQQPLLLTVSPQFPTPLSDDDAWNTSPPYG